tara:strand:+ start:846 stop:1355 length:510 start_codon:yes stop_codon:yes gene_type:complete
MTGTYETSKNLDFRACNSPKAPYNGRMMIPEHPQGHDEAHLLPVTFFPNLKNFGLAIGMAGSWIRDHEPELLDVVGSVVQDLLDAAQAQGLDIVTDFHEQEDATLKLTLPIAATWMISEFANKEFGRVSDSVRQELYPLIQSEMVKMLDAASQVETGVESNPLDMGGLN